MKKSWSALTKRAGACALAAGLLSIAGPRQAAEAKNMNPIRQSLHITCPPGFFPSSDRCIKRITIIKGQRG